jgi:hypothetical protein
VATYTLVMRKGLLLVAYFTLFGGMVLTYGSWSESELVVMAVVGVFLLLGLALWLYIAQDHWETDE